MAGLGFSPESSWLQKELIFSWPKPTAWITTTKLFEDFSRFTVRQVESPHVGGWKLSFAVTLFTCRSVSNPEQEAFVKVYKQVPHVGTEFDSHQARRAQAGEKTHADIDAYKRFMEAQASYLPVCLGHKVERQDYSDCVPGGGCISITSRSARCPACLCLNEELFWSFNDTKREAICKAFLCAYE